MELNRKFAETKKQSIRNMIVKRIDDLLNVIEKAGDLDYFMIEIKNHEGNLNVDLNMKNREKVYWWLLW